MKNYSLHDTFLIRTPSLPFDGDLKSVLSLSNKDEQICKLQEVFKKIFLQEAIYLASPILYKQLLKWLEGKKLTNSEVENLYLSLLRYLTRMSTRCTPFGLFAGCTVGKWADENLILLKTLSHHQRYTRLDMNYVGNLVQNLAILEDVQESIKFYPNNSLYKFGDKLRYISYKYIKDKRVHEIAEIENNIYIDAILNATLNGCTIEDLVKVIFNIDDTINSEECRVFVKELITENILVSELDLCVSGKENLFRIIEILDSIEKKDEQTFYINDILHKVKNTLGKINSSKAKNYFPFYYDIQKHLDRKSTRLNSSHVVTSRMPSSA